MATKTANELLLDAMVRHQTYLLRYSGYVRNRIWSVLDASEAAIAMQIRDRLRDSTGLQTAVDVRRMEALLAAIDGIRRGAWEEAAAWLQEQMLELSHQEPIAMRGIFATAAPVTIATVMPSPRLLRAIVMSRPFDGRVMKEWAAYMEGEDLRRIHAQVQMGMLAGEGSSTIARRVVGTGTLDGVDGATEATRRQAAAIARTAVQHVANSARDAFMMENADVILAEVFVATLDSRTTMVCRAQDGKRYAVGTGPRPPLHWQCRSLRVAAFDGESLATRPFKSSTTQQLLREFSADNNLGRISARDDLPRGFKTKFDEWARKRVRELTGRVPHGTSYQTWLEGQSRQFQEDTLGITKARLFRDGGLKLDKFVAADGTELTLAQLARKHADAFTAAGLSPQDFD